MDTTLLASENFDLLPFGMAFYRLEQKGRLFVQCTYANSIFKEHIPLLEPTGNDAVWHPMQITWADWLSGWKVGEAKDVLLKSSSTSEWCRLHGQRHGNEQLAFQLYKINQQTNTAQNESSGSAALRQQLTRLRSFLDSSTDAIQVSDINGRMLYINREGADRLGINGDEIHLFTVADFEPLFRQPGVWEAHLNDLRQGSLKLESVNQHYRLARDIPVEVNVSLREVSGQEYVIAISRDITDRLKAAEDIQKHTSMLEILIHIANNYINVDLEKAPHIIHNSLRELAEFVEADRAYIFDYDFENNVCHNTYEWCATGISPEIDNLQGIPLDYIPQWVNKHRKGEAFFVDEVALLPDDLAALRDLLEPQGIISLITVPMVSPDGLLGFLGFDSVKKKHIYSNKEKQLLDVFSSMLVNIHLRVKAVRAMQEAVAEAEAASKAKSEFLTNMSHELRTPLNGVIGFTELLKSTPLTDNQLEFVENASTSAHSLMDLINDVLDLSKIEAGKLELDITEVDLYKILEQSIDIVKYEAGRKELELVLDIHAGVPNKIEADGIRLKQILINLLGNAVKFTEAGEVSLLVKSSVKKNKLFIDFEVHDTGIGITEEQQTRLFQAFSQADSSTTRKFGGTGLGLTIANYLTQKMGGNITLKSTPGVGSVFAFTLTFSVVRDVDLEEQEAGNDRKKIWIIDDHEGSRKALKRSIDSNLYDIQDFATIEAIMPKGVPIAPPDVLIVDYHMPGINGEASLSLLKERGGAAWANVPAIMLHRATEPLSLHPANVALGIRFKLSKPARRVDLKNALNSIFAEVASSENKVDLSDYTSLEQFSQDTTQLTEILIVDDVPLNLSLARRMIQRMVPDILIREARNGLEAVAWIEKGLRPQLIFMDVQMPELDGMEATRQIRLFEAEDGIHIPIIALTAGAVKEEKDKCMAAGMDDFLSKPIHMKDLEAMIQKYLYKPTHDSKLK